MSIYTGIIIKKLIHTITLKIRDLSNKSIYSINDINRQKP